MIWRPVIWSGKHVKRTPSAVVVRVVHVLHPPLVALQMVKPPDEMGQLADGAVVLTRAWKAVPQTLVPGIKEIRTVEELQVVVVVVVVVVVALVVVTSCSFVASVALSLDSEPDEKREESDHASVGFAAARSNKSATPTNLRFMSRVRTGGLT
jgi:hypothetical protein